MGQQASRKIDVVTARVLADISRMRSMLKAGPGELYDASPFWNTLGQKHAELIEEYGFGVFKRTINFEYNQWGVQTFGDPKIRALLEGLWKRRRLPLRLLTTRAHRDAWADVRWPDEIASDSGARLGTSSNTNTARRQLAYAFYVALLWAFAVLDDDLGALAGISEPAIGAPIPITRGGRVITQDLALSSLELNRIARHVDLAKIHRVAEIGAGYGRLVHLFVNAFPEVEYSIFDIPPALAVAQHYLAAVLGNDVVAARWTDESLAGPETRVSTFLPYQLESVPDDHFDLVINVSSLDEMSPEQVANYIDLIDRKCRGWLYLKGYSHNAADARRGLASFPYKERWSLLVRDVDPVVGAFEERVYKLR
ncbi:MAG: putative sugar O-methyltransferase [Thermoanaerobaculia bacterium]